MTVANGEYPHLVICPGDWHKPLGEPGCVCDRRYKSEHAARAEATLAKAQAENARLREALERVDLVATVGVETAGNLRKLAAIHEIAKVALAGGPR